jgi:putative two-component system response regulator
MGHDWLYAFWRLARRAFGHRLWIYDMTGVNHLVRAGDLHDPDTERHAMRVADLSLEVARELGMRGHDLANIWIGALLHDIGKIGVPDSILNTRGPLNAAGWLIIKRHPLFGYRMLLSVAASKNLLEMVMFHHEHFDGAGYPFGLVGEEIPLAARIVAATDAYDAICSDRPYRAGRAPAAALEIIEQSAGKHFDPAIVAALRRGVERSNSHA